MTKEELESKFEDSFDANTRSGNGGYGPDVTDRRDLFRSFYPVISEYTKQQAIAFGNWVGREGYFLMYNETNRWRSVKAKYQASWTTEELYNKFIEQQNKG